MSQLSTAHKIHDNGNEELQKFFVQSPILFEKTSDIDDLTDPNRTALSGIGLSWGKYNKKSQQLEFGLSSGLPIDVMSYLSVIGQRHKHAPDAPKTIFLISDYFAQGLPGISDEDLTKLTEEQTRKITNIASNLIISGTEKKLIDCMDIRHVGQDVKDNQECFDGHYNNLAHHENDYERRQTAAIAMYREVFGANLKISYAFEDAVQPSGKKDERSFDQLSDSYNPTNDMSFVYVDVGRATDTSAAKACPYITSKALEEKRLMIGDADFLEKVSTCKEYVSGKSGKSGTNARKRLTDIEAYLNGLANLIESTFTVTPEHQVSLETKPLEGVHERVLYLQNISKLSL